MILGLTPLFLGILLGFVAASILKPLLQLIFSKSALEALLYGVLAIIGYIQNQVTKFYNKVSGEGR
jgi:hypothetical protein